MVRTEIAAFIAIALACIALGCGTSAHQQQPQIAPNATSSSNATTVTAAEQVPAPTLHSGDIWVDRIRGEEREFRIEQVQDGGRMEVSFWGTEMTTDPEFNIIVYRSLTEASSTPSVSDKPGMWFPFPLYPGKTWVNDFRWHLVGASPNTGTGEDRGKVIGWESVTVPAGTFRALKTQVASRFIGKGGMADQSTLTYWYVPQMNRFVKFDYHSNYEGDVIAELVAYKPARHE